MTALYAARDLVKHGQAEFGGQRSHEQPCITTSLAQALVIQAEHVAGQRLQLVITELDLQEIVNFSAQHYHIAIAFLVKVISQVTAPRLMRTQTDAQVSEQLRRLREGATECFRLGVYGLRRDGWLHYHVLGTPHLVRKHYETIATYSQYSKALAS